MSSGRKALTAIAVAVAILSSPVATLSFAGDLVIVDDDTGNGKKGGTGNGKKGGGAGGGGSRAGYAERGSKAASSGSAGEIVVIQGGAKNDKTAEIAAGALVSGMKPDDIRKKRKEMDDIRKALTEKPADEAIPADRTIDGGETAYLHIPVGRTCIVEFRDIFGNKGKITYVSVGSSDFSVKKFGDNMLEVKSLKRFGSANMIVGLESGDGKPAVFEIREGSYGGTYDAHVTYKQGLSGIDRPVVTDDAGFKLEILDEAFRLGKLSGYRRVGYEVYSIDDRKSVMFSPDKLKIYRVDRFGRTYFLVILRDSFEMYGVKGLSSYMNTYNVYLLEAERRTFVIRTKRSFDLARDRVERYRIVIKG